jgi:hypothetical protein
MASKYYFQEKDFPATVPTFAVDASQAIEDKIKLYSGKGRAEKNRHIIFAYQDALRIVRKLEEIYLKKMSEGQ